MYFCYRAPRHAVIIHADTSTPQCENVYSKCEFPWQVADEQGSANECVCVCVCVVQALSIYTYTYAYISFGIVGERSQTHNMQLLFLTRKQATATKIGLKIKIELR